MLVDNVYDKEYYGFIGSFFKISPTVIDDYTKKKYLNMQLENLRLQRNIENNEKKYDERYQINIIDEKESNEIDQIGENKEETLNKDTEVLKLGRLSLQKNIKYIEK